MKKLFGLILISLLVLLTSCGSEEISVNSFKERKDNYYISEDEMILIDYKTDHLGALVSIDIDRLLYVDELFMINNNVVEIDDEYMMDAGSKCSAYYQLEVAKNIKVGNAEFKYNRTTCEYIEVDRDNNYKSGSFVRRYPLDETIDMSLDTAIYIVHFDSESVEKFIEISRVYHTAKSVGVHYIEYNVDAFNNKTEIISNNRLYNSDIVYFEKLIIFYQSDVVALEAISGVSPNINLIDFNEEESNPIIDNFNEIYSKEITAIEELFDDIQVITNEEEIVEESE